MARIVVSESPSGAERTNRYARRIALSLTATEDRLSTLRGASVRVDTRRVVRALVGVVIVSLVVAVVSLAVAGVEQNARISGLHRHGVPVDITVSGCLGLLGGSGSNAAGYACSGSFELGGKRYAEGIPGNVLLEPGTKVMAVANRDDPSIIALPGALANEEASWRVFVLPGALFLTLLALAGMVGWRRRSAGAVGVGLSS